MMQQDAPSWVPSRELSGDHADSGSAAGGLPPGGRQRLPDRRRNVTLRIWHVNELGERKRYDLNLGFHGAGGWQLGEIFLNGINDTGEAEREKLKTGCDLETHLGNAATLASKLLQFGERVDGIAKGCAKGSLMRHVLTIAAAVQANGPGAEIEGVEP